MLFAQPVEGVLKEADARKPAKNSPPRRRSKSSRALSRPNCRGSKRSTRRTTAGEVEELNGFFRRYALASCSDKLRESSVSMKDELFQQLAASLKGGAILRGKNKAPVLEAPHG